MTRRRMPQRVSFALLFALFAFVVQHAVLETHMHARSDIAWPEPDAARTMHRASLHVANASDACLLCDAQQVAADPLPPADIGIVAPVRPQAESPISGFAETTSPAGRSHVWRSRAPPLRIRC